MSLKKKYLKVFQAGFDAGIKATNPYWNGESATEEHNQGWEIIYKSEVKKALDEFIEFMEKGGNV